MLMCITVTYVDNNLSGILLLTFVNKNNGQKSTRKLLSRDF